LATVRVLLPSKNARDLIDIDDAISQSTLFSVKLTRINGSGGSWRASATTKDEFLEIYVPAGTYDIVMCAGAGSSFLLATGYVQNREIVLGSINTVNITLRSLDITIQAPDSVEIGVDFNVTVILDFKNPLIDVNRPRITVSSTDDPVKFQSFEMSNTSSVNEGTTNTFVCSHIAATYAGSGILTFYLDVDDSINIDGIDWYIRNNNLLNIPITFYDGNGIPRVAINATWGND
jgi:hypothetical protein